MNRAIVPLIYLLAAVAVISHSVTLIAVGLAWLLYFAAIYTGRASFRLNALGIAILVMLVWSAVTAVMNGLPIKPIDKYSYYAPLLLIPFFMIGRYRVEKMFAVTVSLSSVVVLLAFIQRVLGGAPLGPLDFYYEGRMMGVYSHPIPAAAVYSMIAITSISFIFIAKVEGSLRVLYSAATLVSIVGLLLTQTRSFYIAFSLAVIIMIVHTKNKRLMLISLAAFAAAALYVRFNQDLYARFLTLFDPSGYQSNVERIAMWSVAWDVVTESWRNFLFGVGFGGWKLKAAGYFKTYYPSVSEAAVHAHVHNIPLQVLLETGVVGLVIMLTFIYLLIKALAKKAAGFVRGTAEYAFVYGMMVFFVCYLVGGLFDYLHMPGILAPMFVFFSIALGLKTSDNREGVNYPHSTGRGL